ncbi:MAG: hypothetical protein FJX99_05925 [Bacteroidetes bacterium]|nr:hypothetical protein [Bacteroidota bacterium]
MNALLQYFERFKSELKDELKEELLDCLTHILEEKRGEKKQFYTVDEFVAITGINKRRVRYRIKTRKLDVVYMSNTVLIPASVLENLSKKNHLR